MIENQNNLKQSKSEYILIASALFIVALILIYIAVYSPPLVPENIASKQSVVIQTTTKSPTNKNISTTSKIVSSTTNSDVIIININTATVEQLITLDGIGEKIAKRIIDYRTENGAFTNIDELMNVSGIGEKKFNAIKKFISVN